MLRLRHPHGMDTIDNSSCPLSLCQSQRAGKTVGRHEPVCVPREERWLERWLEALTKRAGSYVYSRPGMDASGTGLVSDGQQGPSGQFQQLLVNGQRRCSWARECRLPSSLATPICNRDAG